MDPCGPSRAESSPQDPHTHLASCHRGKRPAGLSAHTGTPPAALPAHAGLPACERTDRGDAHPNVELQAGWPPAFSILTWHSQWGSGRSHRVLRDQHHKPQAALPVGSAQPWQPHAAVWCPSPAGTGSLSSTTCPQDVVPGPLATSQSSTPSPLDLEPTTGAYRVEEVGLGAQ